MKKILLLSVVISLLMFGCNQNNEEKETNEDKTEKIEKVSETPEYLDIEGNDIWVRAEPTDGDVVMKLKFGDKGKILEKGKEETIRGVTDYWYKIEYEGKTGWVFGSQTSKKLSDAEFEEIKHVSEEQQIIDFINNLVDIYEKKDIKRLKSLYYLGDKTFYIDNPGAYIMIYLRAEDPFFHMRSLSPTSKYSPKFEEWPVYDMETEGWSKNGIFIQKTEPNTFSRHYDIMEQYDLGTYPDDKKVAKDIEKITKYQILFTDNVLRFYIAKKDGKWMITGIGTWDFSA